MDVVTQMTLKMHQAPLGLSSVEHLLLAIAGAVVSMIMWHWTGRRFSGFLFDELRLFVVAFLTAGLPEIGQLGYMLFWVMMVDNSVFAWPTFFALIVMWWLLYSVAFLLFKWLRRGYRR